MAWAFRYFFIVEHRPGVGSRSQEIAELKLLYASVSKTQFPKTDVVEGLVRSFRKVLDYELSVPMRQALQEIVKAERFFQAPPDFDRIDLKGMVELRKTLKAWEVKNLDGQELANDFLIDIFLDLAMDLPRANDPSPFTIPLIYALPDPRWWISNLYLVLLDDRYMERELFTELRKQLYLNICYESGIEPNVKSTKKPKLPLESALPLDRLNDAYLRKTPFHALMATPVPLKFTHEDRFNHMHLIGGTGAGKTTLIENLIRSDLQSADPPSLVVIDPHSDLIGKLTRADLGIEDRVIIIDPRDVGHPPALNVFAMNQERLAGYDQATQEQVTAGVIQTFDYLFSGLFGADLTAKQGVFFRYVTRLMLSLPQSMGRNATILDMLHLMTDPTPYANAIAKLPDIPREFFLRDFSTATFKQTKEQIRYRLQAIIENPTLARLFTSPESKLDLFEELNRGSVILVDTAKSFLKTGSSTFGRIFISLTLQAVLERAAIEESKRKPTFLIVDEAASYFDSNIDDLLTESRKYRCGCVFAHQYLEQASSSLRASLAANTGIKFASGLSAGDARSMAPEMRTTPDFILNQPRLQFAAHIRNVTPSAVSIPVHPVSRDKQLSAEAYAALIDRNRKRVSVQHAVTPARHPVDIRQQPELPDEDMAIE